MSWPDAYGYGTPLCNPGSSQTHRDAASPSMVYYRPYMVSAPISSARKPVHASFSPTISVLSCGTPGGLHG
jgi:hypothetical protein